jgi:hypothetical protein
MTQLFRITHIDNLPSILEHGMHSPQSLVQDPNFKRIGFPMLIDYRRDRVVPVQPGGSPMLYVIHKGNDPEVIQTPQEDIIYVITSFQTLLNIGCQVIFTDRHAKLDYAKFYQNPQDLDLLDWGAIKTDQWGRQFGAERKEMKQAECLVYQHVPCTAIIGIAVMNEAAEFRVNQYLEKSALKFPVKIKPNFYF